MDSYKVTGGGIGDYQYSLLDGWLIKVKRYPAQTVVVIGWNAANIEKEHSAFLFGADKVTMTRILVHGPASIDQED